MRFSTVLAILAPASAAVAQTVWPVAVGNDSTLTFQPNTVSASVGDIVQFFFTSKNHTVTQSSFAAPCTPINDNATNSGFMPVDATVTSNVWPGNSSAIPTFNYTVTDASAPLWFYCAQTNPISHCESGMVFAINPTENKSFAAFRQNAIHADSATASAIASASSESSPPSSTRAQSTPASVSSIPEFSSAPPPSLSSDISSISLSDPSSVPSSETASIPSSDAATSASSTPISSSPSESTTPSSTSASATSTSSSPAGTLRPGMSGVLLGSVGLLAFVL